jgi:hypothetical protein
MIQGTHHPDHKAHLHGEEEKPGLHQHSIILMFVNGLHWPHGILQNTSNHTLFSLLHHERSFFKCYNLKPRNWQNKEYLQMLQTTQSKVQNSTLMESPRRSIYPSPLWNALGSHFNRPKWAWEIVARKLGKPQHHIFKEIPINGLRREGSTDSLLLHTRSHNCQWHSKGKDLVHSISQ